MEMLNRNSANHIGTARHRRQLHNDSSDFKSSNGLQKANRNHDDSIGTRRKNGVRVFRAVESLTNQLIATDKNFQAIYDAVMIQLIVFTLYILIRDSFRAGRLYLDLSFLSDGIGAIPILLVLEVYLLLSVLLVYPFFKLWQFLYQNSVPRYLSGCIFILLYTCHVVISGLIVGGTCLAVRIPPFTTLIIAIEQMRLCMKSYSFVRENAYKVVYPWSEDDQCGPAVWYSGQLSPRVGSFRQYLYFLAAPTLLYRDHYPRNEGPINWKNVVIYLTQFLTTIWYLGVLGKDFTSPSSLLLEDLVQCYLSSLLCAFFGFILIHTCVFHGYMNFISELLRFADREFYQDWWTSTSFSSYYRKWNTIVHDWIHSYLYSDMKTMFKSPLPAVFAAIFVSAFAHEYLLALALRFASPILLVEFAGLGVLFYLMRPLSKRRFSNFLVLFCLSMGGANLVFYYQVEFASRLYCPRELDLATFFMPRMFECLSSYNSTTR